MDCHQNIISNLYALLNYLGKFNGSRLMVHENFKSIHTPGSSWPNFIYDLILQKTTAKTQLQEIITTIENNRSPNYIILDDEQVQQHEGLLIELNFSPLAEWACLVLEQPAPIIPQSPLEIREVSTLQELQQWVEVASTGFGKLDSFLFENCLGNKALTFYAGYHQSRMVATAMLFFDHTTAGIYHVVTLPEEREKGFGSQLFSHCQQEAQQHGATEVIAQSTQQGLSAWKNTGMKQYGNFYLFCWNKPSS